MPGVTRDRQYGHGLWDEKPFIVIDTAGLTQAESDLDALSTEQAWQAVSEADRVLFMLDAKAGLMPDDIEIAHRLRRMDKTVYVVVNKVDGLNNDTSTIDFYALGLGEPIPVAASQGRGVGQLLSGILADFAVPPVASTDAVVEKNKPILVAVVGRPNVGKSTLINSILGENRVVVSEIPGTTRDSIFIPFQHENRDFTLIDTAGVRRKAKIADTVEKFSVVKTLQAIEIAQVVVFVLDGSAGIGEQDLSLLGFVLESGRSLVLAFNKCDLLTTIERDALKSTLSYRLNFLQFAKVHYISALKDFGIGAVFRSIVRAYDAATRSIPTSQLTRLLADCVTQHAPPLVNGRRIKLRYAHMGGHNPPLIIIHGNQTEHIPESYRRFLCNALRDALKLEGTPIRIDFKTGENPFAGRKNTLTPRQEYSRKRLKDFHKKKERKR